MAVKNSIKAIPLSTTDAAELTPTGWVSFEYALPNPCFFIRINNASTGPVTVSYDGVTAHDFVFNGDYIEINGQTNAQPQSGVANFQAGTNIYLQGADDLTGNIYLSGYYSPTGI